MLGVGSEGPRLRNLYELADTTMSETFDFNNLGFYPGMSVPYGSPPVVPKTQLVIPIVSALPESGKANDVVSFSGKIYVYDGRSWAPVIKEEKDPEEEKGRRIILEEEDAVKCDS
jgi:hypothetical protein